jgi:hypothetical protein
VLYLLLSTALPTVCHVPSWSIYIYLGLSTPYIDE